jgi:hypothetical protein
MYIGEKRLWREVIKTAISDVLNPRTDECARRKAFNWLFSGTGDFESVCDLAEIAPEKVREAFLKEKIRRKK